MSTSEAKRIGIAVVEQGGCYLVGTRGPDSPLAGYAEFPGGKCLPVETAEACAVRECREEAGLDVVVDRLLLRRDFTYPHAKVDLHFFLCHPASGALIRADHKGFRWIPATELKGLKLPEANGPVVELLIQNVKRCSS